jgi:hypothetical protein
LNRLIKRGLLFRYSKIILGVSKKINPQGGEEKEGYSVFA